MGLSTVGKVGLLILTAALIQPVSHAEAIDSGLWQMKMESTVEGLPFAMPPTVTEIKQCVTQKDLVPKNPNDKNCTLKNQRVSGNKVSWEFECNEDGVKAVGKGTMSYSGSTCSGTSIMTMSTEGQKMVSTTKMSGKRLGKCNGEEQTVSVNGRDVKQMQADGQKMAEKGKKAQDKMQSDNQKAQQLISRIKIPKEGVDACKHHRNVFSDISGNSNCHEKWGDLNIREGEWEITEENVTKQGEIAFISDKPVVTKACLSPFSEPSYQTNNSNVLKRSGNIITWGDAEEQSGVKTDFKGGIEFKGETFEGGTVRRVDTGGYSQATYTRISARRIGDGDCVGRDLTAKRIQAQKKIKQENGNQQNDAPARTRDNIENPIRQFRSIFGI